MDKGFQHTGEEKALALQDIMAGPLDLTDGEGDWRVEARVSRSGMCTS